MIALLDTSDDLQVCREELGCPVEQLLTPLTRFKRQNKRAKFAIDNGAFAGFKQGEFKALLLREKDAKEQCRFLAVPDVVGSARRTLEVFQHWRYQLTGWPLALVIQDGIEDLEIPWNGIAAIFIGGSTEFKLSSEARSVVAAAKAIGKWTHVGRVNTPGRFEYCEWLNVDSIDGTGISRYSHMRKAIRDRCSQPNLLTGLVPNADEFSAPELSGSSTAAIANAVTVETGSGEGVSGYTVSLENQADHESYG